MKSLLRVLFAGTLFAAHLTSFSQSDQRVKGTESNTRPSEEDIAMGRSVSPPEDAGHNERKNAKSQPDQRVDETLSTYSPPIEAVSH